MVFTSSPFLGRFKNGLREGNRQAEEAEHDDNGKYIYSRKLLVNGDVVFIILIRDHRLTEFDRPFSDRLLFVIIENTAGSIVIVFFLLRLLTQYRGPK